LADYSSDLIQWQEWLDHLFIAPAMGVYSPGKIPNTREVELPIRAVQEENDNGQGGYSGPCPPHGQTPRYFFKMYGLDTLLSFALGATMDQLIRAMQGHIVQFGEIYITYG
jgi:Raf kinase inhibitor-like YbhB/YbcL family protein